MNPGVSLQTRRTGVTDGILGWTPRSDYVSIEGQREHSPGATPFARPLLPYTYARRRSTERSLRAAPFG
jgi:hypothetical protein